MFGCVSASYSLTSYFDSACLRVADNGGMTGLVVFRQSTAYILFIKYVNTPMLLWKHRSVTVCGLLTGSLIFVNTHTNDSGPYICRVYVEQLGESQLGNVYEYTVTGYGKLKIVQYCV